MANIISDTFNRAVNYLRSKVVKPNMDPVEKQKTEFVSFSSKDSQPRTYAEWRNSWLAWGYNEKILFEEFDYIPNTSLIPDDYPQRIVETVDGNPTLKRIVNSMASFLSAEKLQVASRNKEAEDYINSIFDAKKRYNFAQDAFVLKGLSCKMTFSVDQNGINRSVEYIPFMQTRRNSPIMRDEQVKGLTHTLKQSYGEKPCLIFHAPDFRLFDTNGNLIWANQFRKLYPTNSSLFRNSILSNAGSGIVADPEFKELMGVKVFKPYKPENLLNMTPEKFLTVAETTTMYWDYFGSDPYYPTSEIEAAMEWAVTSNKINEYFDYLIDNQITGGLIIGVPVKPGMGVEEKQAAADEIYERHSGKRRAGKPILHFYEATIDGQESKMPQITELRRGTEIDQTYLNIEERATERIVNALGAYPHLVGLKTASGFSDKAEEMDNEFKFMEYLTLNIPKQLLANLFNSVLKEKFPNEEVVIITKLPLSNGTTEQTTTSIGGNQ